MDLFHTFVTTFKALEKDSNKMYILSNLDSKFFTETAVYMYYYNSNNIGEEIQNSSQDTFLLMWSFFQVHRV